MEQDTEDAGARWVSCPECGGPAPAAAWPPGILLDPALLGRLGVQQFGRPPCERCAARAAVRRDARTARLGLVGLGHSVERAARAAVRARLRRLPPSGLGFAGWVAGWFGCGWRGASRRFGLRRSPGEAAPIRGFAADTVVYDEAFTWLPGERPRFDPVPGIPPRGWWSVPPEPVPFTSSGVAEFEWRAWSRRFASWAGRQWAGRPGRRAHGSRGRAAGGAGGPEHRSGRSHVGSEGRWSTVAEGRGDVPRWLAWWPVRWRPAWFERLEHGGSRTADRGWGSTTALWFGVDPPGGAVVASWLTGAGPESVGPTPGGTPERHADGWPVEFRRPGKSSTVRDWSGGRLAHYPPGWTWGAGVDPASTRSRGDVAEEAGRSAGDPAEPAPSGVPPAAGVDASAARPAGGVRPDEGGPTVPPVAPPRRPGAGDAAAAAAGPVAPGEGDAGAAADPVGPTVARPLDGVPDATDTGSGCDLSSGAWYLQLHADVPDGPGGSTDSRSGSTDTERQ